MAETKRGKPTRVVREYRRRGFPVRGYNQQYDKPRGAWSSTMAIDAKKATSKTAWVKDSRGKFVGRMNKQMKTRAKNVKRYAFDETRTYRERGKYGRIAGRN